MKMWGLVLVVVLALSGCASFQHTETISTDASSGYAVGEYSNISRGPNGNFTFAGGGGGWGSAGAGGLGLGAITINTGPPDINACKFARSVAMINYSKRLKGIKYDETGGIIDYDFSAESPPTSSEYQPSKPPSLPSSFGHQPIE